MRKAAIRPNQAGPRRWVKLFVNPFYHKRGHHSKIRWGARLDVFPHHRFDLGKYSTIEQFTVINNAVGDIVIGDETIIGIFTVIQGPVQIGNGCGTGQHVFISGFNHDYEDGTKNSRNQGLVKKQVIIEDEVHIGSNTVVLPGVRIGKRSQIGAGSVVTKNIPPLSVAAGNPARVIKRFNNKTQKWEVVQ